MDNCIRDAPCELVKMHMCRGWPHRMARHDEMHMNVMTVDRSRRYRGPCYSGECQVPGLLFGLVLGMMGDLKVRMRWHIGMPDGP